MTDQHSIPEVLGVVDTHALTHHAAVVDSLGRELADREFPATATPAGDEAFGAGWPVSGSTMPI